MYHFFIDHSSIKGNEIIIEGNDAHHIRDVLRIKQGEEVSFSLPSDNDNAEYRGALKEFSGDEAIFDLLFIKERDVELPVRITLFQGLPKGDKMETIIQKSVELGVFSIVPTACKRSIVKLDEKKAGKKLQRWQAISESAAKQSQRGIIPEVLDVVDFKAAVKIAGDKGMRIFIPYEKASGMEDTKKELSKIAPGEEVAVFIGPEGGFSEEEVSLAREAGGIPITLGKRILRTETAGMTFLSWMVYLLEK